MGLNKKLSLSVAVAAAIEECNIKSKKGKKNVRNKNRKKHNNTK